MKANPLYEVIFLQEPLEMFKCRIIVAHWHVTNTVQCAFDTNKRWSMSCRHCNSVFDQIAIASIPLLRVIAGTAGQ